MLLIILAFSILAGGPVEAAESPMTVTMGGLEALKGDYRAFYGDGYNYLVLASSLAAAGTLANSSADREVREYYRDDVRSDATDGLADVARLPGEALFTIPALAGVRLLVPDTGAGRWAGLTLRALFLGGPLGLFLQAATGAGRPNEGGSGWRPGSDNNGLSGHAFLGATPFITAAMMRRDAASRAALYALSTLPGLTRINDDKHYLSQFILGWTLAYVSSRAVVRRDSTVAVMPAVIDGRVGAALRLAF
ncbi:MAG: hypothetical protein ACE5EI_01965 [Thermodesulfobacteriota bacterium]